MIRAQFQITEDQAQRLKIVAHREGVSISEIVRRCLAKTLTTMNEDLASRYAAAASLVGIFNDASTTDLAENHDEYLVDAFSP
jgi:hypothetical protein